MSSAQGGRDSLAAVLSLPTLIAISLNHPCPPDRRSSQRAQMKHWHKKPTAHHKASPFGFPSREYSQVQLSLARRPEGVGWTEKSHNADRGLCSKTYILSVSFYISEEMNT